MNVAKPKRTQRRTRPKSVEILPKAEAARREESTIEPPRRFFEDINLARWALAFVVVVALVVLLMPGRWDIPAQAPVGDFLDRDIKAPETLWVEDREGTRRLREERAREALAVYDFDAPAIGKQVQGVAAAFEAARKRLKAEAPLSEAGQAFQQRLQHSLPTSVLSVLEQQGFSTTLEKGIQRLIRQVMERGVLKIRSFSGGEVERGVILRVVGARRESHYRSVDSLISLNEARRLVRELARGTFAPEGGEGERAAVEIARLLILPNVTFNKHETELNRQQAAVGVKPIYRRFVKGEVVFREGQRIAEDDRALMDQILAEQGARGRPWMVAGLALLVMGLLAILYADIHRYRREFTRDIKRMVLLGIILVGTVAAMKLSQFLLGAFADRFALVDPGAYSFALPVATGAILLAILFDVHLAIVGAFLLSLMSGVLVREEPLFPLFAFAGSMVAAFSAMHCRKRSALLRAGLYVGLTNMALVVALGAYRGDLLTLGEGVDLIFAFSGGMLVAMIASGALPLLESLFNVTTDIKLVELLDLNQPLLRQMLLTAPGTYHHSMVVANLAEAASEAVGVNPLLTRVSTYYHDIGKIRKPEYFIENQVGAANRHDRLSPSMSVLIITSHIKEGVDLAREQKLPQPLVDAIEQHHGTRHIKFFYEKAKTQLGDEAVNPDDYRYPGPKPQNRVTAIIMLADAVEAASRVLANPTPSRISALVNRIVTDIFLDEQLNECDLTLKDLRKIMKTFTRILTSIYHHRVEYPGMGIPTHGKKTESPDLKPPAAVPRQPAAARLAGQGDPLPPGSRDW